MRVGGYDCPVGGDIAGRDIPGDNVFFLTSFGGGSDTQPVACGGPIADGSWWYAAGATYRWPCGTKLIVTNPASNVSCIVKVVDVGPNICVEQAAGGPVLDASPLVARLLFGTSSQGWEDHARVVVNVAPDQSVFLGPTSLIAQIGSNWPQKLIVAGFVGVGLWAGYEAWKNGELAFLGLPPAPRRSRRR